MSTQSVSTKHPEYMENIEDWTLVRHCRAGERTVKEQGPLYLPPTSGMRALGMQPNQEGWHIYQAYKSRAVFPDLIKPAIQAMIGVMHREPATFHLPPGMEDMRKNATLEGESLQVLLMRINEQQIITGRVGLLVDIPSGAGEVIPYIAMYEAESIINWDESRREDGRMKPDMVVLDESGYHRMNDFGWDRAERYLVLDLVPPGDVAMQDGEEVKIAAGQVAVYRSRLFTVSGRADADGRQTQVVTEHREVLEEGPPVLPSMRGRTLDELPFVFVGSVDLAAKPDQIPLLGLANLSMTIYRGEADYRHSLFMQGQDTLVIIGDSSVPGEDKKTRLIGASGSLDLPMGAEAKYIGVTSDGLEEQREALQNDRNRAAELGANLLSSTKGGNREAEETLRIRIQAKTSTILSIVKAGAAGLEAALKIVAKWRGFNPDDVMVTPNLDFTDDKFTPKDLIDFMAGKNMGAPVSLESIHAWLRDKDVTTLTLEEEMALIDDERPVGGRGEDEELVNGIVERVLQRVQEAGKPKEDPED